MNQSDWLNILRKHELDVVCSLEKWGGRLLDLGAGTGWQSKLLASKKGLVVDAIDIADSNYKNDSVYPVQIYDGINLPFPDNTFDIVFSSNVLEHIPHVEFFQKEIQRVLKKGGIVVHVLPSGSWRFWTNIAHYPSLLKRLFNKLIIKNKHIKKTVSSNNNAPMNVKTNNMTNILKKLKVIYPPVHGEIGNSITELYYFSHCRWKKLFNRTGWKIAHYCSNRLFYTGYSVAGSFLSLEKRKILSRFFGSSCHVYVLKNEKKL